MKIDSLSLIFGYTHLRSWILVIQNSSVSLRGMNVCVVLVPKVSSKFLYFGAAGLCNSKLNALVCCFGR